MQGVVGGVEGGSWAPFSAFPAEVGAVGQLTLAELEPGVGRERGEEGTCGGETGEVWTGPDRTGPPPPGVASRPSREGTGRGGGGLAFNGVPAGRAIMVYLAQSPHFREGETEAWSGAATAQGHAGVSE